MRRVIGIPAVVRGFARFEARRAGSNFTENLINESYSNWEHNWQRARFQKVGLIQILQGSNHAV